MDPIADFFTRIRNAYLAKHATVTLPLSRAKAALAQILVKSGYLTGADSQPKSQQLTLTLRYIDKLPAVTKIRSMSTPGRRVYVRANQLTPILGGQGLSIVSTSTGFLTDKQARQKNLGGELICEIW